MCPLPWSQPTERLFERSAKTGTASATRDASEGEGVEFIHEDDGSITARDIETGVASFVETKVKALRMLAEAIELHEGGGEPVTEGRSKSEIAKMQSSVTRTYPNSCGECFADLLELVVIDEQPLLMQFSSRGRCLHSQTQLSLER